MGRNPQMYTFGDESSPVRANQKHRRGRNYLARRKGNYAASSAASAKGHQDHPNHSFQQGGQNYSSAAARANQPQATYYSTDGWDSAPISAGNNNDETGSLNYSTSSSVQSAESSSNSSSFAEILKHIDSDLDLKDYSDPEIKDFMAKQSKAANDQARVGQAQYGKMRGMGMDMPHNPPPAAVAGWMHRREQQQRQHQTQREAQLQMQQAKQLARSKKARQQQYAASSHHVDLNYSRDSTEEEIDGVNISELGENELETIAGKRDDDNVSRLANITITTSRPQAAAQTPNNDIFRGRDPFGRQPDPRPSRPDSPSNNRNRSTSGHVTPPPNSRGRRTSSALAPPGSAGSISRTSSRHSKSSSDGSFDTPAPSSPPRGGAPSSKPPHARSSPTSKSRQKGGGGEDKVVEIGSYQNPWFCGFTDALNLDGAFR